MKLLYLAAGLTAIALPAFGMADDSPTQINGGEAVCTGVGSAENDPRWPSYPVRVVFSNGGAQFVAGEHVAVTRKGGSPVATLDCDAPWVLLKLPAGDYMVSATLSDRADAKPRTALFHTSGSGPQQRVEVQFPRLSPNQ